MYRQSVLGLSSVIEERPAGMDSPRVAAQAPTVFVINSDASVRRTLEVRIRSAGWRVSSFASAAAFLCCSRPSAPGCLILESVLPDSCGLELQGRVRVSEPALSVVFVIESSDVPWAVRAMRAGAAGVLASPIDDRALLATIEEAIERSRATLEDQSNLEALRKDHSSLSKREREVMTLIVSGMLNKQVGFRLGISEITVKVHRAQVMRKMKARSFADLVAKAIQLGRHPGSNGDV